MVLALCMTLLSCFGLSAPHRYEWDSYHWGQNHHDPQPTPNGYLQQDQRNPDLYQPNQGHFQQDQQTHNHHQQVQQNDDSYQPVQQNDQFQGYPINRPVQPPSTMSPCSTTALPTTQITPVPNSVPNDMPKHRILLRQLFQQVLGPNYTGPALQQLAFLSSAPSLPLSSQVQHYPQPQTAETQYDLPQYIEPPPPPHVRDQFNYYS